MEGIINQKHYPQVIDFFSSDDRSEEEWNTFLKGLVNNAEFRDFFFEYIANVNDKILSSYFLFKIFSLKKPVYDLVRLEMMKCLLTKYPENEKYKMLYLTELIKKSRKKGDDHLDLLDFIRTNSKNDDLVWAIPVLKSFHLFSEIGFIYENSGELWKSKEFYEQDQNQEKIDEINETLKMIEWENNCS